MIMSPLSIELMSANSSRYRLNYCLMTVKSVLSAELSIESNNTNLSLQLIITLLTAPSTHFSFQGGGGLKPGN